MLYALIMLADAAVVPLDLRLACSGSSMVGGGLLDLGPPTQRTYTVEVRVQGDAVSLLIPGFDWRVAEKVVITNEMITGKVRTSIMSKSEFKIDRLSGTMTSQGGFSGQCRKVEGQAF